MVLLLSFIGGRRKATGLSTRSQGTTRKQRQQRQQTVDQLAVAAAAAAAAAQQQQQQMTGPVGCGSAVPPPQPTYPGTWATGPQQGGVPQQFASGPSAPPTGAGQPGKKSIFFHIMHIYHDIRD